MKSRKNLTRFTYEKTSFQGWRMNISRAGSTFTKYYSDRKHGEAEDSLKAAETALNKIKETIDESKRVNGKLSKSTINKIKKILKKG